MPLEPKFCARCGAKVSPRSAPTWCKRCLKEMAEKSRKEKASGPAVETPARPKGSDCRTFFYVRVSHEKQGYSGLGMEGQLLEIRNYCRASNGDVPEPHPDTMGLLRRIPELMADGDNDELRLVVARLAMLDFFVDVAESGGDRLRDRPAGANMSMQLRKGDRIVIAKFDRAFRDMPDFTANADQWTAMGIEIRIVSFLNGKPLNYSNSNERAMIHMHVLFADWERGKISERNKSAAAAKKQRQLDAGTASYPNNEHGAIPKIGTMPIVEGQKYKGVRDCPVTRAYALVFCAMSQAGMSQYDIADRYAGPPHKWRSWTVKGTKKPGEQKGRETVTYHSSFIPKRWDNRSIAIAIDNEIDRQREGNLPSPETLNVLRTGLPQACALRFARSGVKRPNKTRQWPADLVLVGLPELERDGSLRRTPAPGRSDPPPPPAPSPECPPALPTEGAAG